MLKKIFSLAAACMILNSSILLRSATASTDLGSVGEFDISTRGSIYFVTSYYPSNDVKHKHSFTANQPDWSLFSCGNIYLNINNNKNPDYIYGANIGLITSTINSRISPSNIYIEVPVGKFEFGSGKGVSTVMKISGSSSTCDSKFWPMFIKSDPLKLGIDYLSMLDNFLDRRMRSVDSIEYARKVSYYTPTISGLQFGISYTPDTTNSGSKSLSDTIDHTSVKIPGFDKINLDFKNCFALGLSYEHAFDKDFIISTAIVAEMATTVAKYAEGDKKDQPIEMNNLSIWTIGGKVKYGKLSLSAGFNNNGNGLLPIDNQDNTMESKAYDLGFAIAINEDLQAGVGYFSGNQYGNKLQAYTVATEYKISLGLTANAEYTYYNAEGKYYTGAKVSGTDETSGQLVSLGIKLVF